ncbi:DUF4296 domain-containing protein [Nafulsella turpanensis]|uniref:DUF4296 domain-containing protein n=1 Tax=Nafulsella turpanensis TaxID=1265690 RepID=UPI0003476CB4|nr:DUF4296 domain-containing protein [Nafulsella turpanensis]
MKNLFLLLLVTLLTTACSNNADKPENVLSQETLVRVMADLQLAEAKVKNLRVSTDSARQLFSIYELQIFEEWNISPEQYTESYEYYLNEYDEMSDIHAALIDTLSRRQKAEKERR